MTLAIFDIFPKSPYFPYERAILGKVFCGAIYDAQTTPEKRALS